MQPTEAQRGTSHSSQLLDSLKVYLNNKNRLQPIIGLGCIVECVKAGTHRSETLYLCEACACRLGKADVRNHITGSLHRYNYIKARDPQLVSEWGDDADLSKLAWSLMEKAKALESKEGPGNVQLLEVGDAVYQMMASHHENDAVHLINILRDKFESQSGAASVRPGPVPPHRSVTLGHNRQQAERSHEASAEARTPPSLTRSPEAPSFQSNGWFYGSVPPLHDTLTSLEASAPSETGSSFLDSYTGVYPLTGLSRVVECRSEAGHTHCFLCHCCRVRSNRRDVVDHLTSSSHLVNYLMEARPGQMEVLMADVNGSCHLLQSLAMKVEQDEGRGELTVINAPESLCVLMTTKSYHWCVKMLCKGWTRTGTQKRKIPVKGTNLKKTSNRGVPVKCAAGMRVRNMKMRKKSNTVFKVSLPLTKGSLLLERTSFSEDSIPESTSSSHPSNSVLSPLDFRSYDCESDCDDQSFPVDDAEHATSQLQQDFDSRESGPDHLMGLDRTYDHHQEMDGYTMDYENLGHSEYWDGTKDARFYGDKLYNRQQYFQERSSQTFDKECQNENPETEWVSPAVSHTQDGSSTCCSSYGGLEDGADPWYYSNSPVAARTEVSPEERQMFGNATWHYNQQLPQCPYTAQEHASPSAASVWQRGLSGKTTPQLDAAWINMYPHLRDFFARSVNIWPKPTEESVENDQTTWQTHTGFTTEHVQRASQSHVTHAVQVVHGMMSNPRYNTGPLTEPDCPHSPVIWTPGWS